MRRLPKIVRRAVIVVLIATIGQVVKAQDDVAFTNYWAFQSFYNPAAAGAEGMLNVRAAYRMEMAGFEDGGKTMLIQGDMPMFFLPGQRHGCGVGFLNDMIGLFSLKRIWLQYAYHLPIKKVNRLSFGANLVVMTDAFDGSKVELGEGSSSGGAVPTSSVSGFGFDLDLGLRFSHKDIWTVGASVTHVLGPSISLGDEKRYKIDFSPTIHVIGGHCLRFHRREFALRSSARVMSNMQSWRADITERLCYDGSKGKMYGGVTYSPTISVGMLFGIVFHGVSFGYSYEMYTGGIAIQNGTHELHIGYEYDLTNQKKGRNFHQSVRWL